MREGENVWEMNEEVGGGEGQGADSEGGDVEGREKLTVLILIQLTICELQYSCQQSVGSIIFLWTEPPVIHVGQTHWKPETLQEVKGQKGLSRKLHTKQFSLPNKQVVENTHYPQTHLQDS